MSMSSVAQVAPRALGRSVTRMVRLMSLNVMPYFLATDRTIAMLTGSESAFPGPPSSKRDSLCLHTDVTKPLALSLDDHQFQDYASHPAADWILWVICPRRVDA